MRRISYEVQHISAGRSDVCESGRTGGDAGGCHGAADAGDTGRVRDENSRICGRRGTCCVGGGSGSASLDELFGADGIQMTYAGARLCTGVHGR